MNLNYYVYNQIVPLGQESCGTSGKMIIRDLKTLKGVIRRANSVYSKTGFMVYTFTNFYSDSTFTLQYTQKPKK